jgi:hypothetical protein
LSSETRTLVVPAATSSPSLWSTRARASAKSSPKPIDTRPVVPNAVSMLPSGR